MPTTTRSHPVRSKEMPDKMSAPLLHRKRNDSERIEYPASERIEEQLKIFPKHPRQEYQSAPAENHIQRHMQFSGFFRSEDTDQGNSGNDQYPVRNTENDSRCPFPEEKPHRRECAADQKINGNIVKPPPQAFHRCPPFETVIQAAHQEHHNKTDAVNQGSAKLHPCIGAYQQQDKSCDPQKRSDPMSHRIPDFLEDRPFRRLLPDCVREGCISLHF